MTRQNLDTILDEVQTAFDQHLRVYVETQGRIGHVWDTRQWGGRRNTALVLRIVGRKSRKPRLVTLLYAPWGNEYVVVGSKAGGAKDPDWYLNLIARPDFEFQVGGKCWKASWRLVPETQKAEVWDYMIEQYPPYQDYRDHTTRDIPLVLLSPHEEIAPFLPDQLPTVSR